MDIVQIAWGEAPCNDAEVISKADALRRVAEAVTVRGYEPGWSPWDLAVAFGLCRYEDSRFEWYHFTSPKGEVICASRDGETYWVQDGLEFPAIR